ncbi:hypothetical protein [Emticicia sp. TH156]|nr:hypothetical protein [Emticicia sp. TH156]
MKIVRSPSDITFHLTDYSLSWIKIYLSALEKEASLWYGYPKAIP